VPRWTKKEWEDLENVPEAAEEEASEGFEGVDDAPDYVHKDEGIRVETRRTLYDPRDPGRPKDEGEKTTSWFAGGPTTDTSTVLRLCGTTR
jgi:hypothetical protein